MYLLFNVMFELLNYCTENELMLCLFDEMMLFSCW
mgnify:CR=1 FL=1